jgi:hypothetical protein
VRHTPADPLRFLAVPLDSLHLDPAHARLHGEKNLETIKASLARCGQRKPVVVQKDGMIVAPATAPSALPEPSAGPRSPRSSSTTTTGPPPSRRSPTTAPQKMLGAVQYSVVVDVDGEKAQADLLERLEKEGYTCRALMS